MTSPRHEQPVVCSQSKMFPFSHDHNIPSFSFLILQKTCCGSGSGDYPPSEAMRYQQNQPKQQLRDAPYPPNVGFCEVCNCPWYPRYPRVSRRLLSSNKKYSPAHCRHDPAHFLSWSSPGPHLAHFIGWVMQKRGCLLMPLRRRLPRMYPSAVCPLKWRESFIIWRGNVFGVRWKEIFLEIIHRIYV